MTAHHEPRWYRGFNAAIFALLACNTAYYGIAGSRGEALDSSAWFALLLLFNVETRSGDSYRASRLAGVVRLARIAAAATVGAAAVQYVRDREWLDAANIGLWIAVVVLLEAELRYPQLVTKRRRWMTEIALLLYSGLLLLMLIWLWREAWMDAYDATLWLIAFAMIELDILGARRHPGRATPATQS